MFVGPVSPTGLELGFHAAGAHEAPAAKGFVNGKDSEGG
jgi:hypothetical protein